MTEQSQRTENYILPSLLFCTNVCFAFGNEAVATASIPGTVE